MYTDKNNNSPYYPFILGVGYLIPEQEHFKIHISLKKISGLWFAFFLFAQGIVGGLVHKTAYYGYIFPISFSLFCVVSTLHKYYKVCHFEPANNKRTFLSFSKEASEAQSISSSLLLTVLFISAETYLFTDINIASNNSDLFYHLFLMLLFLPYIIVHLISITLHMKGTNA